MSVSQARCPPPRRPLGLVRGHARESGILAATGADLRAVEGTALRRLTAHSIALLRISVGAVFLALGLLTFFASVSPAEDLVVRTVDNLMLGAVPGSVAAALVATLECVIGLCLICGRAMRAAVYRLAIQLIGILSPLVLLAGRMFDGPHGAPTLEGQAVLKDVTRVGAPS
jgi:putative oxidoreductase